MKSSHENGSRRCKRPNDAPPTNPLARRKPTVVRDALKPTDVPDGAIRPTVRESGLNRIGFANLGDEGATSSGNQEGVDKGRKSKRRWWELQFAGPPRRAYVLGSLILLVGLARLISFTVERGHWWLITMGVYFTLCGVLMLLGASASSREAKASGSSSS